MDILGTEKTHTILNSNQQIKKDKRLQPLIPLHVRCPQKPNRSSSKIRSSSSTALVSKSQPSYHSCLAGRDSMREEIWQSWWSDDSKWNTWSSWSQDKMVRDMVAKSFRIFFHPRGSVTRDGNLPVTDGRQTIHRPQRHIFQRLRTPVHASTHSLIFLHGSRLSFKLRPSRFIVAHLKSHP